MSKQAQVRGDMVKTLKISEETHERLKKYGKFGDSFEDILNRLIYIRKNNKKMTIPVELEEMIESLKGHIDYQQYKCELHLSKCYQNRCDQGD